MQKVEVVLPDSAAPLTKPNALATAKSGEFFLATRTDENFGGPKKRKYLLLKAHIASNEYFIHLPNVVAGPIGWDHVRSVLDNYYAEAPLPSGTKLNITI